MLAHYETFAIYPDIPFDPDEERYFDLERAGLLRIFTVRDQGVLTGYGVFAVTPWLYSRASLQAQNVAIFLHELFRSTRRCGELIRFANEALKAEGVQVVYYHALTSHPALGLILQRLGGKHTEQEYSWRLDG